MGAAPSELDRAIDTIERNARAQGWLIDDLLDVTRIQAGSLHLDVEPVALASPARAAVQAIQPAAAVRSIALELRCESSPMVAGDAGRLQQVVSNLLSNAVKFTPAGGSIQVVLETAGEVARLSVCDTGEGIDPAFLPHVFARFRQASSGSARRHGGLGLGLAISESLVRLHGGTIRAASDGPGRGSVFTVELPLHDAGLGAELERELLVFRPDVLVLDIGLPGEDGYALLRRARRLPPAAGGTTPAISLTAHARNEDRARALAAGFQQHLPKPVDLPQLVTAIRAVVPARERKPTSPEPSA